jgi:DNA-binding winged helix-turn-helix (wHTH) protein/predicted ATPase/type II secretory pathway predicted ATPase ExeA
VSTPVYRFGPFCLDAGERRLSIGAQVIPLGGKVFDTLRILVENYNHLVRKDELMKALWPDRVVEESNLDHNISSIRKALGQQRGHAKYIETVPRQGYRFVAPVGMAGDASQISVLATEYPHGPILIERDEQLLQLRLALERASSGTRQFVLITGEPGIGKTSLVRTFVEQIAAIPSTYVARGECQNQFGEGEPYMPVFEALNRLTHSDGGFCVGVLEKHAPSWLAQLPGVSGSARLSSAAPASLGMTAERMLREMVEAVEFLTAGRNLVLILEDLHCADYSTIDLLARIAQRTEPARLLVLGTYRPSDAKIRSHPIHAIAQQLKLRTCCREMPLGLLTEAGFGEYLRARLGDILPTPVAHRLHVRTQGNPLFLVTVIDSWIRNNSLRRENGRWRLCVDAAELSYRLPDDLRQLIEQQFTELDAADQELIEAASVAGRRFCPATVAPALGCTSLDAEARCAALSKDGRLLLSAGPEEWPDGTVCESYLFLHTVHRDAIYERIPAGRKVRLHQQIASRLEKGHRGQESKIASELAMHFREARDAPRALSYLQLAAEQSLIRSAHREAIGHLTSALAMVRRLPELAERVCWERDLLALLAPALVITKGFADPEAEHAFRRAYELSAQEEGIGTHFHIVFGFAVMLEIRGQYPKAQQLMERHLSGPGRCEEFPLEARDLLACSRFHQGFFRDALEHGEKGAQAYSPHHHSVISAALGEDPGIDCHSWAALSHWFLGHPDRALAKARLAVSLAKDPSRSYSLANAQAQLAFLHQLRQEEQATLDWANRTMTLAQQQGYSYRHAVGQVLRGWALARMGRCDEGMRALLEGMNGCAAVGAELDRAYHLALLAEAHLIAGRPAEAAAVLESALECASATPAFFYMAELYRLRGVSAIHCRQRSEVAERWLKKALEVATSQSAVALQLRAALTLSDLWTELRRGSDGRELVSTAYSQFNEGFETPDVREAASRLGSLAVKQH